MKSQTRELNFSSFLPFSICVLSMRNGPETNRKRTLMMNNFIIIAGILVIIISFTLMSASLLPTAVHAQVGLDSAHIESVTSTYDALLKALSLDSAHIESVTSTYDALLKAPMMISQAAIRGSI